MSPWLAAVVVGLCCAGLVAVVVLLVRNEPAGDRVFLLLGAAELAVLAQLVLGVVALAGTTREVSGLLFVSYLVGSTLALPVGAVWSLAERTRAGTAVLALALLTVVGLEVRLGAIWGGAGA